MRIQVIHRIRIDPGIVQRTQHGTLGAIHVRGSDMACISAHAKPSQLGINFGTTRFGVLIFFEHQHAGTFAQHKTVAVFVPRAAGSFRVFVAGRQRAHRRKAANP